MDDKTDKLITKIDSSDVALTLIGLSMSIASLLIVVSNIGVLVTYFKNKKLRIPSNYFIVSLAVSDIIIGAIPINLYTVYMIEGKWPFDGGTCRLWLCIDYWCLTVSILTLMGIAFDRFFAVCFPYKHRTFNTKQNVRRFIAALWIFAFLLWVPIIIIYPYLAGNNAMAANQCYVQFIFENPSMTLVTATMSYYLPLIIIVTLYACICCKLMKMSKTKLGQSKEMTGSTSEIANRSEGPVVFQENKSITKSAEDTSLSTKDVSEASENLKEDIKPNIHEISPYENPFTITPKRTELGDDNKGFANSTENISKIVYQSGESRNLNHSSNLNGISKQQEKEKEVHKGNRNEKRGVKLLLLVILAFAFTWMPYFIATTIITTTRIHMPEQMWRFCYIFGWLNSLLNPLCYAFGNRNFKSGFKKLLRDIKGRKHGNSFRPRK